MGFGLAAGAFAFGFAFGLAAAALGFAAAFSGVFFLGIGLNFGSISPAFRLASSAAFPTSGLVSFSSTSSSSSSDSSLSDASCSGDGYRYVRDLFLGSVGERSLSDPVSCADSSELDSSSRTF